MGVGDMGKVGEAVWRMVGNGGGRNWRDILIQDGARLSFLWTRLVGEFEDGDMSSGRDSAGCRGWSDAVS